MCRNTKQKTKTAAILLAAGIAFAIHVQGEIYKWTDESGHVHYSDRPPESAPAKELELDDTNIFQSHRDEFWDFEFDGREWLLGHHDANQSTSIREYVLLGQSVDDWTELVTSQHMRTKLSVREYYDKIWRVNPDCPSLETKKLQDSPETIIFQAKHGACGGYEPGEFIQRLSYTEGGIIFLTFAQKQQLSEDNLVSWTRILREARKKYVPTSDTNIGTKVESLPLNQLGPLPENTISEYLETLGTGILADFNKRTAKFTINLKARKGLPRGAYLEAHFPNPSDRDKKDIKSKVLRAGETQALFTSSESRDIKCWNYEVVVHVYRGDSKTKLLGTHRQLIQSKVNYARVKDAMDVLSALETGRCP